MGQARIRGTREERVDQAIERRIEAARVQREQEAAAEAQLEAYRTERLATFERTEKERELTPDEQRRKLNIMNMRRGKSNFRAAMLMAQLGSMQTAFMEKMTAQKRETAIIAIDEATQLPS